MPVVQNFAYGPLNPLAGYALASIGALIGLSAAAQARRTHDRQRRVRWLCLASGAIGSGIWLMHYTAALGFDIPSVDLRYDPLVTAISAVLAIAVVGIGVAITGYGRQTPARVMAAGLFTGGGIAAMHYTGMAAMRMPGMIEYDTSIVAASVLVAVIAATIALWFTLTVGGWRRRVFAAAVMGVAVTGMHYTGMAAVRVHLGPVTGPVAGVNPILLVLPITVIAAAGLIGLIFTALQAMAQEEEVEPLPARPPVRVTPLTRVAGTVHMGQVLMPVRRNRG